MSHSREVIHHKQRRGHMIVRVKWIWAFLAMGLLYAAPTFAETDVDALIQKGSHRELSMHYAEVAKDLKSKADKWEHTAEVYEMQLGGDAADPNLNSHIIHARRIADDYRRASQDARDLAREHRDRVRAGP
jgi:hypothetical protein